MNYSKAVWSKVLDTICVALPGVGEGEVDGPGCCSGT